MQVYGPIEISVITQCDDKIVGAVINLLELAFKGYRHLYTEQAYQATVPNEEGLEKRIVTGLLLVAQVKDEIVGTATLNRQDESGYILGMAVHPEHRGHGIGRDLLLEIMDLAEMLNMVELRLHTTPFLRTAIQLYEKNGFRITGEPIKPLGTTLIEMTKQLKPGNRKNGTKIR